MRSFPWLTLLTALLAIQQGSSEVSSDPVHYYVQLVWGTNHQKPATADFRPVGARLHTELTRIFQWQQYWETNYKELWVRAGKASRIRLSPDCEVEIELISPSDRETRIYGKGVLVTRARRKIHCRNLAIHGGTNESDGSWFVVVREDKPIPGQ
jgi:hypothetical protein